MRIITDSASDITQQEAKELGIEVIPLSVSFGMKTYKDGVTISKEEFYARMEEIDDLPTTSQVSPGEFAEVFGDDEEEKLVILVSSRLSGTYQSAMIARAGRENIHIVDSLHVTLTEKLLVQLAVRLKNEGKTVGEIEDILNEKKMDLRLYALLNTLENLRKGGRISSSVAAIGTLLVIKPIVSIVDGEVKMVGKARGAKNGRKIMHESMLEDGDIDFDLPFTLAYSGTNPENLTKYVEEYQDFWQKGLEELPVMTIGSVIGTHAAANACGIAYFKKK